MLSISQMPKTDYSVVSFGRGLPLINDISEGYQLVASCYKCQCSAEPATSAATSLEKLSQLLSSVLHTA